MLDEITEVSTDSAQKTDQSSTSEKESTSQVPVPYTKDTQDKAVSDALAEQGRKHKEALEPITQERDTFKSQAEQAAREAKETTDAHEETKGRIVDLETDLEQAIGEDGEQIDIQKIKKDLREERVKARQEAKDEREAIAELKKTAEAEREEWAGTVAEAQAFRFDSDLTKLMNDYDGDVAVNFTKLKTACDKAGVKTKEGAQAIAETFMVKKVEEPELVNDSGVTSGSKDRLGDLPPEQWAKALEEKMSKSSK